MSKDKENTGKYQERREKLKKLSVLAKQMKMEFLENAKNNAEFEKFSNMNLNDIILKYLYVTETRGATKFKTFWQWKSERKRVKKGEKAIVLWGKKQHKKQEREQGEKTDKNDYSFFPLVYLFSDLQVETDETQKAKEESKKEPAEA